MIEQGRGTKEWQVVELLKTTTAFFVQKQVDEARISAELLLASVLGLDRLGLYLNHNRPVYPGELEAFRALCRQRLEGKPVQYITGEQFFYGLPFFVDKRVLIPRPETELLVEHALEFLGHVSAADVSEAALHLLDIGTGSGCIAVTLASRLPCLMVTAIDISTEALVVARNNAERHGVADRIRFLHADLFSLPDERGLSAPFDVIVSNPPYIAEDEWAGLQPEVRLFEPQLALTTRDGIECYHAVAEVAPSLLKSGGMLCFESHADAALKVAGIMERWGFSSVAVMKDYSGLDRVVSGKIG
ncbi:peptide chain release factor N(5)-glutamine methyltransferase [Chlorobium phaeobacteroides]|jgi:release factor glutamine methyltransferase|uniref:Release factor glutamine methyltransferase n=1 Tax=Chlorobium phaeobacteroides (strain DSM 266 / SMG 266 / 2430) TaxID=290317 RepID=A1BHL4_CHLPD|nr:peptide chain release factor N(5)-glutamine methyltransferase [Chlorobium phaeobacteroides]ABL65891.1 modification methylase, HemK family [Chlorobium phaeobacteroides DSM 266]MBV5329258.1 peptide chain release factor N(5)-glutamine methyltransferase [Chlorobium sp.]